MKIINAHLIGGPAHGTVIKLHDNETEARVAVRITEEERVYSFKVAIYHRSTAQVMFQSTTEDAVPFVFHKVIAQ